MRRLILLTFCAFNIFLIHSSHSDTLNQIKNLIDKTNQDLNVGIELLDITSGKRIFSLHNERKFIPASTTKLFTAYTALSILGDNFHYHTKLLEDRHGNLYIKFSGDPTLTYDDLKTLLSNIAKKEIKGDLILDASIFDDKTHARGGITWDDTPFYYAAPSSAIIINDNCSKAKMQPNKKLDQPALLSIEDKKNLQIINNVITVPDRKDACEYKSRYLENNTYEVYGCMFQSTKYSKLNFALPDNELMAKRYVEKALEELKINFTGKIYLGTTPKTNKLLSQHSSAPLKDLLVDAMHESHNLTFASLFKYMAFHKTRRQGTDEDAEYIMKNFLNKHKISSKHFIIKDGAGESKYNLVTPNGLTSLLAKSFNSNTKQNFIKSLPQYGSESTMKNRSITKKFTPYVYAKTGNMKNISTLAGYYLPKGNKHSYAFAIMINNHTMQVYEIKALEDKILETLLSDITSNAS